MYADLLREYGVDLRELFSEVDPLTPRRALALIENLPTSSRTFALWNDSPESYGWGTQEYLLAGVIDSVREGTFTNIQVRSKKKIQPFEPFPTPGVQKKKKEKPVNAFIAMAQAEFYKHKEG